MTPRERREHCKRVEKNLRENNYLFRSGQRSQTLYETCRRDGSQALAELRATYPDKDPTTVKKHTIMPESNEEKPYDSTQDTNAHIHRVQQLIDLCRTKLFVRMLEHDASKLQEPEKSVFDKVTPKLKGLTYGSPEYKASLEEMKVALDHHYANNSHHPEHFENGIAGMSLLDLLEMLCDWKAAGERHADGSMDRSLSINQKRFGIDPQLQAVLENTVRELGW